MSLILVFFCLNLRFNQNILHCIYLLFSLSCFTLEQSSHLFFGGVIDNIDIFRIQVNWFVEFIFYILNLSYHFLITRFRLRFFSKKTACGVCFPFLTQEAHFVIVPLLVILSGLAWLKQVLWSLSLCAEKSSLGWQFETM